MADKNVAVKDANGTTNNLKSLINSDGSISFYHVEDVAQRATLLSAFSGLATASAQTTGNTSLAALVNKISPAAVNASGVITTAGVGSQSGVTVRGDFNISVWGTWTGEFWVERSFDAGVNWLPLTCMTDVARWKINISEQFNEPEANVRYRVRFVSIDGSANYRISQ